jgi:hypothetical protein
MPTMPILGPFGIDAAETDVLAEIYQPSINMAIMTRDLTADVAEYAMFCIGNKPRMSFCQILPTAKIQSTLSAALPEHQAMAAFIRDIGQVAEMFACLFDTSQVGVRLQVEKRPSCPRFHFDQITCRLLLTYTGPGTEWLSEDNLDRSKLGRGSQGLPDHQSGVYLSAAAIQRVPTGAIALLKGNAWEGNEGFGLVHRSPDAGSEHGRLVLTLDLV